MNHVVLLGDSIFDNSAYTNGQPDVVGHLRTILPTPWRATLLAVDGCTTAGLGSQVARIPVDASHLVVSVGGNDALGNSDLLAMPVASTAEALALFAERVGRFESAYRAAIDNVLRSGLDATVSTIYNGNLGPQEATVARVGLMLFNDVILRTAFEERLAVIDLRLIVTEPEDYANPIEPSGRGGRKIAEAIARTVGALGEPPDGARVFAG